jgi:hypothetical protein
MSAIARQTRSAHFNTYLISSEYRAGPSRGKAPIGRIAVSSQISNFTYLISMFEFLRVEPQFLSTPTSL